MRFSDEYDRDDLIYINHATFITAVIMLIMAIIAKAVGIL